MQNLYKQEYEDYEIKFVSSTGTNFIINYDFERKINTSLENFNIQNIGQKSNEIYEPIKGDIFLGMDLNHFLYREHAAT